MKALQIVEQGFRTLTEEQDDTILWLAQSMRGAGADIAVLLAGHAAAYAVQQAPQPRLTLGDWQQREPANVGSDLDRLIAAGVAVHVLRDDLDERGLSALPLRTGVQPLRREQLAELYESVDQVWQW